MSQDGLRLAIGQHSQAGRKPVNQDFFGARQPAPPLLHTKGVVLAIADGISSSPVSQVAAAAAVRGFLDDYYDTSEAWTVSRAARCVLDATNSWLHAQNQRIDARFDADRGHVCTFSALIFKGHETHLLHVGDARVFRLHPKALEQLSEDHRIQLSSSESYLSRALGAKAQVEVDHRSWPIEVGEIYLLATDGAHGHIEAADVHAAIAAHPDDLDAAATQLGELALARGSDDNITVQIARIEALPEADALQRLGEREGLALSPPLAARATFEGYTIERELHASSRSHVYLATDHPSGQAVVLKLPSVDLREQADYLDRFQLEEWVARRIDSAHVLKAFVQDRPRQHLYAAMEYIEGQSLGQWMLDHPRPNLAEVRAVIEQVAKGLQAFHRKEMLHQDLRPDNVLIDRHGTVKIIDFASVHVAGLAEGGRDPEAHQILGTLQYTAPEYFLGLGGCPQSDLFSLAVITYQMLTGQLPYGLQVPQVRTPKDVQGLRYVPARNHRPDLPAWLDAALRHALHPDPSKRTEALSEFAHDLRHPRAERDLLQPTPLIERNPVVFWQALSAVLAVALLISLAWPRS